MEIKIPKEVRQHKETIFFGLSARQFFCAAVAVGLVRMLDNKKAIVLIRGEAPVIDDKYDLMNHPGRGRVPGPRPRHRKGNGKLGVHPRCRPHRPGGLFQLQRHDAGAVCLGFYQVRNPLRRGASFCFPELSLRAFEAERRAGL